MESSKILERVEVVQRVSNLSQKQQDNQYRREINIRGGEEQSKQSEDPYEMSDVSDISEEDQVRSQVNPSQSISQNKEQQQERRDSQEENIQVEQQIDTSSRGNGSGSLSQSWAEYHEDVSSLDKERVSHATNHDQQDNFLGLPIPPSDNESYQQYLNGELLPQINLGQVESVLQQRQSSERESQRMQESEQKSSSSLSSSIKPAKEDHKEIKPSVVVRGILVSNLKKARSDTEEDQKYKERRITFNDDVQVNYYVIITNVDEDEEEEDSMSDREEDQNNSDQDNPEKEKQILEQESRSDQRPKNPSASQQDSQDIQQSDQLRLQTFEDTIYDQQRELQEDQLVENIQSLKKFIKCKVRTKVRTNKKFTFYSSKQKRIVATLEYFKNISFNTSHVRPHNSILEKIEKRLAKLHKQLQWSKLQLQRYEFLRFLVSETERACTAVFNYKHRPDSIFTSSSESNSEELDLNQDQTEAVVVKTENLKADRSSSRDSSSRSKYPNSMSSKRLKAIQAVKMEEEYVQQKQKRSASTSKRQVQVKQARNQEQEVANIKVEKSVINLLTPTRRLLKETNQQAQNISKRLLDKSQFQIKRRRNLKTERKSDEKLQKDIRTSKEAFGGKLEEQRDSQRSSNQMNVIGGCTETIEETKMEQINEINDEQNQGEGLMQEQDQEMGYDQDLSDQDNQVANQDQQPLDYSQRFHSSKVIPDILLNEEVRPNSSERKSSKSQEEFQLQNDKPQDIERSENENGIGLYNNFNNSSFINTFYQQDTEALSDIRSDDIGSLCRSSYQPQSHFIGQLKEENLKKIDEKMKTKPKSRQKDSSANEENGENNQITRFKFESVKKGHNLMKVKFEMEGPANECEEYKQQMMKLCAQQLGRN